MPEIRQDATSKEWVILSQERARRPQQFARPQPKAPLPPYLATCPFCPGNEHLTPPEVLSYRDLDDGRWKVRVFPNKYPALIPEGSSLRKTEAGLFLSMDGLGLHEVIAETPLHNLCPALMSPLQLADVLRAYQERFIAASSMPFVRYVVIFRNSGPSAGTSLEHPHSQLVAMPVVPRHARTRREVAVAYYDDTGHCLYADLLERELAAGKRIVLESGRYVAFHPFASHRPFETWIVPKVCRASFNSASRDDLAELAEVLRIVLLKLYHGLNDPDYNYVIDTVSPDEDDEEYYVWHIRIIPRITETAGFEVGSGMYINWALPEETAAFMRNLSVETEGGDALLQAPGSTGA